MKIIPFFAWNKNTYTMQGYVMSTNSYKLRRRLLGQLGRTVSKAAKTVTGFISS